MHKVMREYENYMVEPRVVFANVVSQLISNANPQHLEFFLMHHCVLGASLSAPLTEWVQQAADQCENTGYDDAAKALRQYAMTGFKRHELLQKDLFCLIDWLNRDSALVLDTKNFLNVTISEGVEKYHALHEQALSGQHAYVELAIQYEMERLIMIHGFTLIQLCMTRFGKSILRRLSAFRYQIKQNRERMFLLEQMLQRFLQQHPDCMSQMLQMGQETLATYSLYLLDCNRLAHESGSRDLATSS